MKTSVHLRACNLGASEAHNKREKELDYVRKDLSNRNDSFSYIPHSLKTEEANIKREVKEKTKRKLQKNSIPIKEGVIVIKEDTSIDDLKRFCEECRNKFGIIPLQIHTHKDEGHVDKDTGEWKPNLHAHIVWRMYDDKGKNVRLQKEDLSAMQDMAAECLGMERGQKSTRKHKDSLVYKIQEKEKELKQSKEELQKTKAENAELKEKNTKLQSRCQFLLQKRDSLEETIESLKPQVNELSELLTTREKDLALIDQKTTEIAKFLNWWGASKTEKKLAEQTLSLTQARNDLLKKNREYNELKHRHNKLQNDYDKLSYFDAEDNLRAKDSKINQLENILNAGVTLGLTAVEMKQLTQRSVVPFKREGLIDTNLSLMGGEVKIEHNKNWLSIKDWMSRVGSQIISQIQKAGEQIKSAFKR